MNDNISRGWISDHDEAMRLLQEEAELEEIVKLVGYDSLSAPDRLTLEAARSVREDYLQQNAFDDTDTYTSLNKQVKMLSVIMQFYREANSALKDGADINEIVKMEIRNDIARAKYVPDGDVEGYIAKTSEVLSDNMTGLFGRKEEAGSNE